MAIPSSGPLTLSAIQTEFGGSNPISLNEYYAGGSYVSGGTSGTYGAVPSSGTISIRNFYGTSAAFSFTPTISANTQNYNLRSAAVSAGWNQVLALSAVVTINGGVVVGSNSTGSYAFATGSPFPAGSTLRVNNNGYIVGRGGNGGAGAGSGAGGAGTGGGPALQASAALTMYNYGTVGGGGGGGGGGGAGSSCRYGWTAAGAVGGGGAGNTAGSPNGALTTGGAGGPGGVYGAERGGNGGNGGNLGAAGAAGATGTGSCGGGAGGAGGAAGACTAGNANITWAVTGTRNGALN